MKNTLISSLKSKKIAVLYGGWSAEREVSLASGAAAFAALESAGISAKLIDATENLVADLQQYQPDLVLNALHGRWGEDGCVQGLLEMLRIPYTHSGVLASAVAMHKPTAKEVFAKQGLKIVNGGVYSRNEILKSEPVARPFVIKPINEGSSVGVEIIHESSEFHYTPETWPFGDEVLIEAYIAGREIQVAVLHGKALGAIEIKPLEGFYDYEAKYTDGKAQHLMPAPLDADDTAKICAMAEKAHQALGCRGLTRSDFILDAKGDFYILETNTQPGMTPLSLAPEIAAYAGIDFEALILSLCDTARLDTPRQDGKMNQEKQKYQNQKELKSHHGEENSEESSEACNAKRAV